MKHDYRDLALFVVRMALGTLFAAHGCQKLFGLFGGLGLHGFIEWCAQYHIPAFLAVLGALGEFIGGLLLCTGFLAQLGALMVIPVMIAAVVAIHWPHGYFAQNGGFEYPFNLIFFAAAIVIGGPGSFALYNPLRKK